MGAWMRDIVRYNTSTRWTLPLLYRCEWMWRMWSECCLVPPCVTCLITDTYQYKTIQSWLLFIYPQLAMPIQYDTSFRNPIGSNIYWNWHMHATYHGLPVSQHSKDPKSSPTKSVIGTTARIQSIKIQTYSNLNNNKTYNNTIQYQFIQQ